MDKVLIGYLTAAAVLALFILVWKPLHKRFKAQAIIVFYLMIALAASVCVVIAFDPRHIKDWWVPVFCLAAGLAWLLSFKQEPPEHKPTVAWAVIHGLWDQLEKEGLPSDEIERLKRMTPEERAALMAAIRVPLKRERPRWEPSEHCDIYNGDADEYRCL